MVKYLLYTLKLSIKIKLVVLMIFQKRLLHHGKVITTLIEGLNSNNRNYPDREEPYALRMNCN